MPTGQRGGAVLLMGWHVSDDRMQYAAAEQLHRRYGRLWWVMWAPGIRRFYAFYQGVADIDPIAENSVEALESRMRRALCSISRSHPASFWRCPQSGCAWTSINPMPHSPCPTRGAGRVGATTG